MVFYSGQKVVCVDDGPSKHGDPCGLKKGEVYTVLSTGRHHDGPYVTLHEIDPVGLRYIGFRASRFRPAVDKPTNILIFKRMLKPADELVE